MADPLSPITNVAGIIVVGGKVLVKLTEYISDINNAPKHVEELANDLMCITTSLQRFKLLVLDRQDSDREELQKWAADTQTLFKNCEETFDQINAAVEKAQIKSKKSVQGEIVSRVKWVWNKKETELLRGRLKGFEAAMQLMLQTLSSRQIDGIDQTTQKLHELIKSIQNERQNIKERLVVLDKDHPRFSNPDGIISFQEPPPQEPQGSNQSRPQPAAPQPTAPQPQGPNSVSEDFIRDATGGLESFTKDTITNSKWNAAHVISLQLTRPPDPIDLVYKPASMRVVIASGITPMLEIEIDARTRIQISEFLQDCSDTMVPLKTSGDSSDQASKKPFEFNASSIFKKPMTPGRALAAAGSGAIAGLAGAFAAPVLIAGLAAVVTVDAVIGSKRNAKGTAQTSLVPPPHLSSFTSRKMWYPLAFVRIKRSKPNTLLLTQDARAHSFRQAEGSLAISCSLKTVADEIQQNLAKIITYANYAWSTNWEVFSVLTSETQSLDVREQERLAMNEELKWSLFAAAFAKQADELSQRNDPNSQN